MGEVSAHLLCNTCRHIDGYYSLQRTFIIWFDKNMTKYIYAEEFSLDMKSLGDTGLCVMQAIVVEGGGGGGVGWSGKATLLASTRAYYIVNCI